jgi:predicted RNase H-like HicB family nuclease/uncharacterized damage-inducible protein DinB
MRFDLYLESGPRRRKTMVHVLALPGCIATGPTTEEAIENAPSAIRARLEFLRRHGEPVAAPEPLELVVVEHVTEGVWLGNGAAFFEPDREPLGAEEARRQVTWMAWSREELIAAARAQPGGLADAPAGGGRTVGAILHHVADAERSYLNSMLGPVSGLSAVVTAVERAGDEIWEPLGRARGLIVERLALMTDDELARLVQKGGEPRCTRRMLRRMLEHEWEHLLELRTRLEA